MEWVEVRAMMAAPTGFLRVWGGGSGGKVQVEGGRDSWEEATSGGVLGG